MVAKRWMPRAAVDANSSPVVTVMTAITRGLRGRCPSCGTGHMFKGFLTVASTCRDCEAPLGLVRADDAPPYFTILVVGHVVIPLLFLTERSFQLPLWGMSAIFLPLTLALSLGLIRPIKGGTVGLMFNLNMLKSDPSAI